MKAATKVMTDAGKLKANLLFDGSSFSAWGLDSVNGSIKVLKYASYETTWKKGDWDGFPQFWKRGAPPHRGELRDGLITLVPIEEEIGRNKRFGAIFEGQLEIAKKGRFRFNLWADDKARLFINGKQVVQFLDMGKNPDGDGDFGVVELTEGNHPIRLEYVEYGSGTGIKAAMTGPDGIKRNLTASKKASTWRPSLGGQVETKHKDEGLLRPLTLPETFEIDLDLSSWLYPVLATSRHYVTR
jgi:hypothetical protein